VLSDAAQFPMPSMVPAGQSAEEVCCEAPRLVAEKESVKNYANVRFSLGLVGSIVRPEELLAQFTKSAGSVTDAMSRVTSRRSERSEASTMERIK
jgi:hypothetical protein